VDAPGENELTPVRSEAQSRCGTTGSKIERKKQAMVNRNQLTGNWDEIKDRLREHWHQISNDELQSVKGDINLLVDLIQRKTGEGRAAVEDYLDQITESGRQAAEKLQGYARDAGDQFHEGSRQAAEAVRRGYEQAEEFIRVRPSESVVVCFGAGLVVGLLLGLTLRGR
jgi:ElaB/YqjD/DUF883 family membrane-anchored ribosome-binding protein